MATSFKKVWQACSEIFIFCVIQYIDFQKQLMEGAVKVLRISLKTVLDEVHFIVNLLYRFSLPQVLQENPSFPQVSHSRPSQAKTPPSSKQEYQENQE